MIDGTKRMFSIWLFLKTYDGKANCDITFELLPSLPLLHKYNDWLPGQLIWLFSQRIQVRSRKIKQNIG